MIAYNVGYDLTHYS